MTDEYDIGEPSVFDAAGSENAQREPPGPLTNGG